MQQFDDAGRLAADLGEQRRQPVDDRPGVVVDRGRHLFGVALAVIAEQHDVGKRAADIDPGPEARRPFNPSSATESPSPALRERVVAGAAPRPGEGVRVTERLQNCQNDALGIREDVIVPEPQNTPTLLTEDSCTYLIPSAVGVLSAVRLYSQPMPRAGEIENESTYGMLTPKSVAGKASVA